MAYIRDSCSGSSIGAMQAATAASPAKRFQSRTGFPRSTLRHRRGGVDRRERRQHARPQDHGTQAASRTPQDLVAAATATAHELSSISHRAGSGSGMLDTVNGGVPGSNWELVTNRRSPAMATSFGDRKLGSWVVGRG